MQYIRASIEEAATALEQRLQQELSAGNRVLWLVSGGSNIGIAVQIINQLPTDQTSLLSVMLVDERFGEPGHEGSNWQQLLDAGFDFKQATALPTLKAKQTVESAVNDYTEMLTAALTSTDVSIGLLGIGADGHIAGIMVGSHEAEDTKDLIVSIPAEPYTRLTLTYHALQQLDSTYTFAFGPAKLAPLEQLQTNDTPLSKQPSQILKHMEHAYIYNDQLGEPS